MLQSNGTSTILGLKSIVVSYPNLDLKSRERLFVRKNSPRRSKKTSLELPETVFEAQASRF